MGVTEVVEADPSQLRFPIENPEALRYVARAYRVSGLVVEQELIFGSRRSVSLEGPQCSDRVIVKGHDTPPLCRFGRRDRHTVTVAYDRLSDRRFAAVEIHVAPSEAENLTPTHPRGREEEPGRIETIVTDELEESS